MLFSLALFILICAALPVGLVARNLRLYRVPPPVSPGTEKPRLSVLIPARNEEAGIAAAVTSVLASEGVELEVIVMDDASEDGTAAEVEKLAARDSRVRLERAPALPPGWNGKQHACQCLGERARFPLLVFMDADVRLAPDALARLAPLLHGVELLSGVPRQITLSFSEKLLIPLIHFVLLGFLPLEKMRASRDPAFGAGCGQFFLTTAEAWRQAGGHAAIRASLHDGLHLPRRYRQAGLRTDLADLTPLAHCRMYAGNLATWRGLAKNAHQGMGDWKALLPMTLLLGVGQLGAPLALVIAYMRGLQSPALFLLWAGLALSWVPRVSLAARFQHSALGVLLHPLGIASLLAIQWWARLRHTLGGAGTWKGRRCDVG